MKKKKQIYKPQNCGTSEVEITDEDREYLRQHTYYGQCRQFRESVIDLCWLIAKKLRIREIAAWLERFLCRLPGKPASGCGCGKLVSTHSVGKFSDADYNFVCGFLQKVNAETMTFGEVGKLGPFSRGELLLFQINIGRPPIGAVEVTLMFKIHLGGWPTRPKVMVPRWPAWRGYKFAEIKGAPMLEHAKMQDLMDYLAGLQNIHGEK